MHFMHLFIDLINMYNSAYCCVIREELLRWLSGKELASAGDARDVSSIPGLGRLPGEGKWQSTPVFLPGKFHGQRSVVGYSPWGQKEFDMIEYACTLCIRLL